MRDQPKDATCHSCEKRPIRKTGLFVSRLETLTDHRLYCDECADACAAGLWEGDPMPDQRERQSVDSEATTKSGPRRANDRPHGTGN